MGLLHVFKGNDNTSVNSRGRTPALEAAKDAGDDGFVNKLVSALVDIGIDGKGPLDSAKTMADQAAAGAKSTEKAIATVARKHLVGGVTGGFLTGMGGFFTMPVALPVNLIEFYIQATRMVAGIAHLRGYNIDDPQIRTAVLLTLVGAEADEVLRKAGVSVGGGRIVSVASRELPASALMVLNKAVGFHLARGLGTRVFAKAGRAVPLVGGAFGAGVDGFMMKQIADHAMSEFPAIR